MQIRLRSSLYLKIILWMLLNLAVIGALLFGLVALRYRLDPDRFLFFTPDNQFEIVSRMIADELRDASPERRLPPLLPAWRAAWRTTDATTGGGANAASGTGLPTGSRAPGARASAAATGDDSRGGAAGAPSPAGLSDPIGQSDTLLGRAALSAARGWNRGAGAWSPPAGRL